MTNLEMVIKSDWVIRKAIIHHIAKCYCLGGTGRTKAVVCETCRFGGYESCVDEMEKWLEQEVEE
jgi:hypothetical protein